MKLLETHLASPIPAAESKVSLQPTLERLARIARLGPNWDSYGADPISKQAVRVAQNLILSVVNRFSGMAGARAVPYTISPLDDGGIQIDWRSPMREIEVEVGPSGSIDPVVFVRDGTEFRSRRASGVPLGSALRTIAQVLLSSTP